MQNSYSKKKEFTLGLDIDRINASATLFKGNQVIAHVEEERFIRIKHAPQRFPINAIHYCLSFLPDGLDNVAAINLGFDHDMFTYEVPLYFLEEWSAYPQKPPEALKFEKYYLTQKHPQRIRETIKDELSQARLVGEYFPPINHYGHHYCHALCAHITSPFESSLGIVADGNSELDTYSVWDCHGSDLKKIFSKQLPDSLGWLYRCFTEFCGFEPNGGEGKLMGLAPYGHYVPEIQQKIDQLISCTKVQDQEIDFHIDSTFLYLSKRDLKHPSFTKTFIDLFGEPATPDSSFDTYYQNVAWAIQDTFETILLTMARRFLTETGHRNLTLSGGVALNCKANGHIWRESQDLLDDIYIFPMSGDDGIGYGANLAYSVVHFPTSLGVSDLESAYLGPEFSNKEIEEYASAFTLRNNFSTKAQYESLVRSLDLDVDSKTLKALTKDRQEYKRIQDLASEYLRVALKRQANVAEYTAEKIATGNIVSWFQGRMEAGPRALGNRSILADPRDISNRDRVNEKVKFRELWRPFCPSVLMEHREEYFELSTQCPYMINTFAVTETARKKAPAIVHVDGTARPQFVTKKAIPRYHQLISEFHKLTGVPILLNTSMNIKGEPICCTPDDALQLFFATDIDILVLGDYILEKHYVKNLG